MTEAAEAAVSEFAADCGADIFKMKNSCETYLQQYLRDHPVEQELMIAGLRVGIPDRIARVDDFAGYDDFLSELAVKFERAASTDAAAAKWTVGAWAFALGRPVGYVPEEKRSDLGRVYDDPAPARFNGAVKTVMIGIVMAGGFLGGTIALCLFPLIDLLVDFNYDTLDKPEGEYSLPLFVICLLLGLVNGVLCALAALGGWLYGRGNEYPWNAFGVAFGASFPGFWLYMFVGICLPLPVKLILYWASIFLAVYKTAARGGRDL
jgi:hypothetical protein